ncbi:MAG: PH domain-containing protein [Actinomycetota bacterium]
MTAAVAVPPTAARDRQRREADSISDTIDPPRDGDPGALRLAPGALRYKNTVAALAVSAVALAGIGATLLLVESPAWRIGLLVSLGVLLAASAAVDLLVLNPIEVRSSSYTATPDFVYIARGRWMRRTVVIATSQILNVETSQGPILRALDLVKVQLTCIAEVEAIVPVTRAAARELQDVVLGAQRVGDA